MTAAFPELVSTRTGTAFPFSRIGECSPNGESLEVVCPNANSGTMDVQTITCDHFREKAQQTLDDLRNARSPLQ